MIFLPISVNNSDPLKGQVSPFEVFNFSFKKKLLTDLHESDQKIMDEILERERDLFLAQSGQSSDFKSPDSKISSWLMFCSYYIIIELI